MRDRLIAAEARGGTGAQGRRESEGLVLPHVIGGVGRGCFEDSQMQRVEERREARGVGLRREEAEVGEDGVKHGVFWDSGVLVGED